MNRIIIYLLVFIMFLLPSFCRPPHVDEENDSEMEEAEYEDEDAAVVDDALHGDEDSAPNDQFSEYKRSNDNTANFIKSNDNIREHPKLHQSNRLIKNDANDQSEILQHLANRNVNNYKDDRLQVKESDEINKQVIPTDESSDDGDALFEHRDNGRVQLTDFEKNKNNNEPIDSSETFLQPYCNILRSDNKGIYGYKTNKNTGYKLNRDKRRTEEINIQETELSSDVLDNKQVISDNTKENDESAIKRHIKKLSGEELEELLNSLSEDKRALLNKIMESDQNSESINKREITKKAGAVEEIGYLENGISDSSKIQGYSAIADSTETVSSQNTDATENNKETENQSEMSEVLTSKTPHPEAFESKREIPRNIDVKPSNENSNNCASTVIDRNDLHIESSAQITSKNANKREATVDNLTNVDISFDNTKIEDDLNLKDSQDTSIEQNYICSEDEDLSQLMNEDAQLYNTGHYNKRDTYFENQKDLSDSIKSLEESFPNDNGYDDPNRYSESNMIPLVRVKRKNDEVPVQKRAAALLPDPKVAYFPYRAENDDEDNEESNEFEDNGFYDRTSNYAKNNANKLSDSVISQSSREAQPSLSANINMKSDTDLGSDTDNVLMSVEGVDDNLMYNSGSRKRDTTEYNSESQISKKSIPFLGQVYQANDKFGLLPRNYEGDSGRHKRIRYTKL